MKYASLVAALLLAVSPAMADLSTKVVVTDGPGSGNGGAFTVTVTQGSITGIGGPGSKFLTFCLELNEFVSDTGAPPYWVDVTTSAMLGGYSGGSPDPLDPKTAALYTQWLGLGDNTDATANIYQLAIWVVEDEVVWDGVANKWRKSTVANGFLGNPYQSIGLATVNGLIAGVGNPASIGGVRVLRLWSSPNTFTNSTARQDLLVTVPAPGAALLVVLGAGLVSWARRRAA